MSGWFRVIISQVSSVEPLSTINISTSTSWLLLMIESTQAATTCAELYVTIITETSGSLNDIGGILPRKNVFERLECIILYMKVYYDGTLLRKKIDV